MVSYTKEKIKSFLNSESLVNNFSSIKEAKDFLGDKNLMTNEDLKYIIGRLRDSHNSYRMSYDKFTGMIVGIGITLILVIISFPGILKSSYLFFILILLIIVISLLIFKFVKSQNLKEKKGLVDKEILQRIISGSW